MHDPWPDDDMMLPAPTFANRMVGHAVLVLMLALVVVNLAAIVRWAAQ